MRAAACYAAVHTKLAPCMWDPAPPAAPLAPRCQVISWAGTSPDGRAVTGALATLKSLVSASALRCAALARALGRQEKPGRAGSCLFCIGCASALTPKPGCSLPPCTSSTLTTKTSTTRGTTSSSRSRRVGPLPGTRGQRGAWHLLAAAGDHFMILARARDDLLACVLKLRACHSSPPPGPSRPARRLLLGHRQAPHAGGRGQRRLQPALLQRVRLLLLGRLWEGTDTMPACCFGVPLEGMRERASSTKGAGDAHAPGTPATAPFAPLPQPRSSAHRPIPPRPAASGAPSGPGTGALGGRWGAAPTPCCWCAGLQLSSSSTNVVT